MINRHTVMAIVMITSTFLAIASTGCTRVYQTTMQEMSESEQDRLAARVAALRESSLLVRDELQKSASQVRIVQSTADETHVAAELAALDLSVQRLPLHVWNLRRHIASVRDVADDHMALYADDSSLIRDRYQTMLADSDLAHEASQQLIDVMADRNRLLSADASERRAAHGTDSHSPARDPGAAVAAASEHIDAALYSIGAFLNALPRAQESPPTPIAHTSRIAE